MPVLTQATSSSLRDLHYYLIHQLKRRIQSWPDETERVSMPQYKNRYYLFTYLDDHRFPIGGDCSESLSKWIVKAMISQMLCDTKNSARHVVAYNIQVTQLQDGRFMFDFMVAYSNSTPNKPRHRGDVYAPAGPATYHTIVEQKDVVFDSITKQIRHDARSYLVGQLKQKIKNWKDESAGHCLNTTFVTQKIACEGHGLQTQLDIIARRLAAEVARYTRKDGHYVSNYTLDVQETGHTTTTNKETTVIMTLWVKGMQIQTVLNEGLPPPIGLDNGDPWAEKVMHDMAFGYPLDFVVEE